MNIKVGNIYKIIVEDKERAFRVFADKKYGYFEIVWDDGESESVHRDFIEKCEFVGTNVYR